MPRHLWLEARLRELTRYMHELWAGDRQPHWKQIEELRDTATALLDEIADMTEVRI